MFTRLYLHIPFCRRKCPYCAFVSRESAGSDLAGYVELLLTEMRLAAETYAPNQEPDSIYFGGGTPSLLAPEQTARLIEEAGRLFGLGHGAEITLEANPGTVDPDLLSAFRATGINRLSLGVQSFDDRMLTTLGRIHTSKEAEEAFLAARAAGFGNIGIDLIHALPGQTAGMWRQDLERSLLLAPDHISVYGLTVEEGTPFAGRYDVDSPLLPDDDLSASMFETADDLLTTYGYEHYEIANYARPGFRSRHNGGYWRRDGYLGLGAGAHSFLRNNEFGTRFGNATDLDEYAAALQQGTSAHRDIIRLSREDAMAEQMFLGLRMADGVDLAAFEQEFGTAPATIYGAAFEELASAGLLITGSGKACLTRRGMLLSNQVFTRFLP